GCEARPIPFLWGDRATGGPRPAGRRRTRVAPAGVRPRQAGRWYVVDHARWGLKRRGVDRGRGRARGLRGAGPPPLACAAGTGDRDTRRVLRVRASPFSPERVVL